jgi:hypothetical protein
LFLTLAAAYITLLLALDLALAVIKEPDTHLSGLRQRLAEFAGALGYG